MSRKRKPAFVVVRGALFLSCALWGFRTSLASAYMLNLEGGIETPGALFAEAPGSGLIKVLERGAPSPTGGTITDIGIPALALDGSVIFGAEVTGPDRTEWRIFRANPLALERRVEPFLDEGATRPGCRPALKIDPRVSAGADGSVVFVGNEERGGVALFHYANMRIDCEIRLGDRTADGHLIANLGFGSAQAAENGVTVLRANLFLSPGRGSYDTRNAILLARPGKPPLEIAVEGNRSADGEHYGAHFGLPAIGSVDGEFIVAFTNHNTHGSSLFVGQPDNLHAVIAPGSRPLPGPPAFLSEGRPSIAADGSLAIGAESGTNSLILTIRTGEPLVVAKTSDLEGSGREFSGFGDPVPAIKGSVYAEAVGHDGAIDRLYSFPSGGEANPGSAPAVLSGDAEVFPGSLAADRSGRYAFLARSPGLAQHPVTTHPAHVRRGRSI